MTRIYQVSDIKRDYISVISHRAIREGQPPHVPQEDWPHILRAVSRRTYWQVRARRPRSRGYTDPIDGLTRWIKRGELVRPGGRVTRPVLILITAEPGGHLVYQIYILKEEA